MDLLREKIFTLLGGECCLDFCNTVGWHTAEKPAELLPTPERLVAWGFQAGLITEDQAADILREWEKNRESAVQGHAEAIKLRESMFRIFLSLIQDKPIMPKDFHLLNNWLTAARSHNVLSLSAGEKHSLRWSWNFAGADWHERLLWPVVHNAAELLASPRAEMVRLCEGPGCGWLFLDQTKNRKRRWCSMQDCGNRAKAKRHYQRKKAAET